MTNGNETSLVVLSHAAEMLIRADTIQKTRELKDLALTAADWAKRKEMGEETILYCQEYSLRAEKKMGQLLKVEADAGRLATREKGGANIPKNGVPLGDTVPATTADIGITRKERSNAQKLAELPEDRFEKLATGEISRADAIRETKREEVIATLENIEVKAAKKIEGVYDVIVCDPPWPMKKIELDVLPTHVALDYPTMTLDEIGALTLPCAPDCHFWLWTTHKFLPDAFSLLMGWELKYVCCFVWHKTGGFQPIGLPQYNCEFALYARKGSPKFIDTKTFNTCFQEPREGHSVKPDGFYRMISRGDCWTAPGHVQPQKNLWL